MPKLLKFVEKMHPILREIMPEEQKFQDLALQQIIEDMCYSIQPKQLKEAGGAHESAAGMAANQWGLRKRIFIYTPDGSGLGKKIEIMLNPSYTPYLSPGQAEPKMVAGYEGCFSIPLTVGIVNRYEAIVATYYTPEGERVMRVLQGWEARVFQHETDHLNGRLFDGRLDNYAGPECLERYTFKDKNEMNDFYEGKAKTIGSKKS